MKQRYVQIKRSGAILLNHKAVTLLNTFYTGVKDIPNCNEIDGYETLSSIMEEWREKHIGICEFCEKEMPISKVRRPSDKQRKRVCSNTCRSAARRIRIEAETDPSLSFEKLKKEYFEAVYARALKELEKLTKEDKDQLRRNLLR